MKRSPNPVHVIDGDVGIEAAKASASRVSAVVAAETRCVWSFSKRAAPGKDRWAIREGDASIPPGIIMLTG